MYKSIVTSKGQTTIPKQIREHLALIVGDSIIFNIMDDHVQMQKDNQIIKCPVCEGNGFLSEKANFPLPCFFCDGSSTIQTAKNGWDFISTLQLRKYNISFSVIQQEIDENNNLTYTDFPKVTLNNSIYMTEDLYKGNDYIQLLFIKEYLAQAKEDEVNHKGLDHIMSSLHLQSSKDWVKEWL